MTFFFRYNYLYICQSQYNIMAVISYKLYLVVQQAPRLLLKQHYFIKRDKFATLNILKQISKLESPAKLFNIIF